jgi:2-polyprenyl-6-methoxyphenol hydroxylase-like FAD-dependent oxidoreductase
VSSLIQAKSSSCIREGVEFFPAHHRSIQAVRSNHPHADCVEVKFDNGVTAEADVAIGADVIHSTVLRLVLFSISIGLLVRAIDRSVLPLLR